MKLSRFIFILLAFLLSASVSLTVSFAQDQTCLGLVDGALAAAREICSQTNRHEICYGHVLVNAQAQGGFDLVGFDSPGDVTSVSTLQSLKLSEFDTQSGDWGVAQMRLQTSISNEQSGDVTVLVFGDVEIQNSVPVPTLVEVTIGGQDFLPAYTEPSSTAIVEQLLISGTTTTAVEQSPDGLWLRVELPSGNSAWVEAVKVTATGDLSTLNIGEASVPYYHPMQAFYFQSGENPSSCSTVPANGLLIQTPEGVGKVNLLINEVNIQLGSTAFLQAVPGKQMTISLLEGSSTVETQGVETTLIPGTQVFVPLDENLIPNAPPSDSQPYELSAMKNLPVHLLEREIVIEVPPTAAELAASGTSGGVNVNNDNSLGNGLSTSNNGNSGGNSDNGNAGGNSGGNSDNGNAGGNSGNGNNGNGNSGGNGDNGNGNNGNGNSGGNGDNGNGNNGNGNSGGNGDNGNGNNGNGNSGGNGDNGNGNNGNGNSGGNGDNGNGNNGNGNGGNGNNGNGNNGNGNGGNGNNGNGNGGNGNNGNGNGGDDDD